MIEKHDGELSQQELAMVVGGLSAQYLPPLNDQKTWLRKRAFAASQGNDEDQDEKRRHGKLGGAVR